MENLKSFNEIEAPVEYLPGEQWTALNINSKGRYLISTKGRIYSYWAKKCLENRTTCGVHVFEYTPKDGKHLPAGRDGKPMKLQSSGRVCITVQRLVAFTFLEKKRGSNIVIHTNGNSLDDAAENLRWVTRSQALKHARQSPKFQASQKARGKGYKLTGEKIKEIKKLLKQKRKNKIDISIKEIAARFGIAEMNVYRIQNGDIWSHVGKVVKQKETPVKRLTDEQAARLKRDLQENKLTGRALAALYNITPELVSKIKKGKAYKNQ